MTAAKEKLAGYFAWWTMVVWSIYKGGQFRRRETPTQQSVVQIAALVN
jgi:hypothetical protein